MFLRTTAGMGKKMILGFWFEGNLIQVLLHSRTVFKYIP